MYVDMYVRNEVHRYVMYMYYPLIPPHETPSRFNRDVHRLISLDVISNKHESE